MEAYLTYGTYVLDATAVRMGQMYLESNIRNT